MVWAEQAGAEREVGGRVDEGVDPVDELRPDVEGADLLGQRHALRHQAHVVDVGAPRWPAIAAWPPGSSVAA